MAGLTLMLLPDVVAVCRLATGENVPDWGMNGRFWCVTRTADELSVVCAEVFVPEGVRVERGWRVLQVVGPLDFSLTGVLASLARPLADAGVPIFALSTFDTDYVLVKQEKVETAVSVLRQSGHVVMDD
ncbi:MAG: ACT domain-containing protein [Candidatus Promineifilaceae bacterium]